MKNVTIEPAIMPTNETRQGNMLEKLKNMVPTSIE